MNDERTVGLGPHAHEALRRLKEDGVFGEMLDAYRFAVALALVKGEIASSLEDRRTVYAVGNFDPDQMISAAIKALRPDDSESPYKIAERLAEWGVLELSRLAESGNLDLADVIQGA